MHAHPHRLPRPERPVATRKLPFAPRATRRRKTPLTSRVPRFAMQSTLTDSPSLAPERSPTNSSSTHFTARESTARAVDIAFGLVLPPVCLIANHEVGLIDSWHAEAYAFIAVEMALFAVWMWKPPQSRAARAWLAGALGLGGLFAALIGAVLFPLSIVALLFGIGFLGLVPIGTAWVFLRAAKRACPRAWGNRTEVVAFVVLGSVAVAFPPFAANSAQRVALHRAVVALRSESPTALDEAQRAVACVPWLDADNILERWETARNPAVRNGLGILYARKTGRTIEQRIDQLAD